MVSSSTAGTGISGSAPAATTDPKLAARLNALFGGRAALLKAYVTSDGRVECEIKIEYPPGSGQEKIFTINTGDPNAVDWLLQGQASAIDARAQDWFDGVYGMLTAMAENTQIEKLSYDKSSNELKIIYFDGTSATHHLNNLQGDKDKLAALQKQLAVLEQKKKDIDEGWTPKILKGSELESIDQQIAHVRKEIGKLAYIDTAEKIVGKIDFVIKPKLAAAAAAAGLSSSDPATNFSNIGDIQKMAANMADFKRRADALTPAQKRALLEDPQRLAALNAQQLQAMDFSDVTQLDVGLPPKTGFSLRELYNEYKYNQGLDDNQIGERISVLLGKLSDPAKGGNTARIQQFFIDLLYPAPKGMNDVERGECKERFKNVIDHLFFEEIHPEAIAEIHEFVKHNYPVYYDHPAGKQYNIELAKERLIINPKFFPGLDSTDEHTKRVAQAQFLIALGALEQKDVKVNLALFRDPKELWEGLKALRKEGVAQLNPIAKVLKQDGKYEITTFFGRKGLLGRYMADTSKNSILNKNLKKNEAMIAAEKKRLPPPPYHPVPVVSIATRNARS